MNLLLHGAGQEVGRSCVELQTSKYRFLFDCGIKVTHEESIYPIDVDPSTIDAVFLSHAHLDHCGALPRYNALGLECPIYATKMTKVISQMILKDSLHVEKLRGYSPIHDMGHVNNIKHLTKVIPYNKSVKHKDVAFTLYDAGHIPGSSSIHLSVDGKTILYSGDIKLNDSLLLGGARQEYPKTDILILEATYGGKSQRERAKEQTRFLTKVQSIRQAGGNVVVPAFAIGRGQEVAMLLLSINAPIYLDGMGKKALGQFLQHPGFVRDVKMLARAKAHLRIVNGRRQRTDALKQRGIFISSAGMMDGGPVLEYVQHCYNDKRSGVLLTGFQACGSNGRLLMEDGKLRLDDGIVSVKCSVDKFEFSAHAGMSELHQLISLIKPKTLITVHGDAQNCRALAEWAKGRGITSYAPMTGDQLKL